MWAVITLIYILSQRGLVSNRRDRISFPLYCYLFYHLFGFLFCFDSPGKLFSCRFSSAFFIAQTKLCKQLRSVLTVGQSVNRSASWLVSTGDFLLLSLSQEYKMVSNKGWFECRSVRRSVYQVIGSPDEFCQEVGPKRFNLHHCSDPTNTRLVTPCTWPCFLSNPLTLPLFWILSKGLRLRAGW